MGGVRDGMYDGGAGGNGCRTLRNYSAFVCHLLLVGQHHYGLHHSLYYVFIFPLFGFLWGLKNLLYTWGEVPFLSSLLWFVGVLVFSLIIPGHILNYKARKENRNGEWGEV